MKKVRCKPLVIHRKFGVNMKIFGDTLSKFGETMDKKFKVEFQVFTAFTKLFTICGRSKKGKIKK